MTLARIANLTAALLASTRTAPSLPAQFCVRCASTSTSSPSSSSNATPATHYRITLRRSTIGLPEKKGKIVESLGLRKRLQAVYRPIAPEIAGSILAVKELLHVDNVRRINLQPEDEYLPDEEARWVDEKGEVIDWGKDSKRAPNGYQVVGNRLEGEL